MLSWNRFNVGVMFRAGTVKGNTLINFGILIHTALSLVRLFHLDGIGLSCGSHYSVCTPHVGGIPVLCVYVCV